MKYVKLQDGGIISAPTNYSTDDGRTICNFDKDPEIMLEFGFKPFIEAQREPGKEYSVSYEETETEIREILTEIPGPTPEEQAAERAAKFDREFFLTSLGYVRRTVHMSEGTEKDFLTDLLPNLAIALNSGIQSPILVYTRPDFTHEIIDWEPYQSKQLVTAQFIQECFARLSNDFLPDFTPTNESTPEEPEEPIEPEEPTEPNEPDSGDEELADPENIEEPVEE